MMKLLSDERSKASTSAFVVGKVVVPNQAGQFRQITQYGNQPVSSRPMVPTMSIKLDGHQPVTYGSRVAKPSAHLTHQRSSVTMSAAALTSDDFARHNPLDSRYNQLQGRMKQTWADLMLKKQDSFIDRSSLVNKIQQNISQTGLNMQQTFSKYPNLAKLSRSEQPASTHVVTEASHIDSWLSALNIDTCSADRAIQTKLHISFSLDSSTGAIDKVYLVFHDAKKSKFAVAQSLKHAMRKSANNINLLEPSEIESKELDKFLHDQIGCQTDNVNMFAALANCSKSGKVCTLVEKDLVEAQALQFSAFGESRNVSGQSLLHMAIKTNQSRHSFKIFAKLDDDQEPQDSNRKKKIVVLGSLNYDVFLTMDRLPEVGETLAAEDSVFKAFGGKGANQAVAAARLKQNDNFDVQMLGQVGSDDEGKAFLKFLDENGVDTSCILVKEDACTGQAYILSVNSDNSIVIVGGSNQQQNLIDLDPRWKEAISSADILLLQREVPQEVNTLAAKYAQANGCKVVLDMGGKDEPLDTELLQNLDIISPNETELRRILPEESAADTEALIDKLMIQYPKLDVLFKRGENGASYYENSHQDHMDKEMNEEMLPGLAAERPAYDFKDFADRGVKLVDTTGAGDSFTGAYAVAMLEDKNQSDGLDFACQVAFLTVSKLGAGPSMPTRDELEFFFPPADADYMPVHENVENSSVYAFVRHAERADRVGKFGEYLDHWTVRMDPPLSERGDRQAFFAGVYFKEYFEKNNFKFDKIVIDSSPFLRCMQTANGIAEALGVKEITINHLYSEHLQDIDFADEDPIPHLMINNMDDCNDAEFKKKYGLSQDITFTDSKYYREEIGTRWLESLEDSQVRAMMIAKHQAERMKQFHADGDITKDKKVCYLVVSHGMMVEQLGNMIDKMETEEQTMPTPVNVDNFGEKEEQGMYKAIEGMDWTGLPNIDYECFNMFAVDVNDKGQLAEVRVLDNNSNGIHMEMKKREYAETKDSN